MNPITSPKMMTGINAVIGIIGVLESTGVTGMLNGTPWGGYVVTGLAVLNALAHAYSPPVAGPLAAPTK